MMVRWTHRSRRVPATGAAAHVTARAVGAALFMLLAGCQAPDRSDLPPPPSAADVRPYYAYTGEMEVQITGNVARVEVVVDPAPYARGGDLWAKGMPYLFLFSQGTRDALNDFPGLGGVRIATLHPNGDIMAEALLTRGTLNDYSWRQALNVAAQARRDATERPGRMRDLVRWGEDHTEFEYNPRYISSP
jgi:hypothetical protein